MKRYSILLTAVALLAMIVATTTPAEAAFPGGNGYIVFNSDRSGKDNFRIYRMNPDGSDQARLPFDNFNYYDTTPAWSSDGSRIAFDSKRDFGGDREVYVMNADGSNQIRLTNNSANDSNPDWSPDGSRIAFNSNRDGDYEIYVMNADGSGLINLTNDSADDYAPVWSPDGTRIAFNSDRDGDAEIYVMNADGSGLIQLTENTASDNTPDWSPDGSRIVFESTRDQESIHAEIYVMNADGTEQTRLTINDYADSRSVWSPDGTQIAFIRWILDTNAEIYVMNADGTGQIRLTTNSSQDYSPSWQPIVETVPINWWSNYTSHQNVGDSGGNDPPLPGDETLRLGNAQSGYIEGTVTLPHYGTWEMHFYIQTDGNYQSTQDYVKIKINGDQIAEFNNYPLNTFYPVSHTIEGDSFTYRFDFYSQYSASHTHMMVGNGTVSRTQVYSEGLVSYWRLDEISGIHAFDSAGSNDGTIQGATRTDGQVGKALSFDGVNDFVDFGDVLDELDQGDKMTVEAWLSTSTEYSGYGSWATIVGRWGVVNDWVVWQLVLDGDTHVNVPAYRGCFLINTVNASHDWNACTETSINDGKLHHLVGVYDGVKVMVYLDGEKQPSEGSFYGNIKPSNASLQIGYNARHFAKHFGGLIDEVAIYNRALTAGEIQQHYQNGLNGLGYEEAPCNTPSGEDVDVVAVDPVTGEPGPVTLTFDDVTEPGDSTVTTSDTKPQGPPIPTSLKLGSPPTYFNIETSAGYDQLITVGIDYSEIAFHNEINLKLMQMTDTGWVDITILVDAENKMIYGETNSLSWFTIVEDNEPPIAKVSVNSYLEPVGSDFTFDGNASFDPDGDVVGYEWTFGDDIIGSGVSVTHSYETAGLYDVVLTVTDDTGATSSDNVLVVVYDPSAGFATGGGWIDSPEGAYVADPQLTGKANFGFVSKYKKGATIPTGNTEFQFKAGDLNFHSDTYEWLVVNQDGTNAQFKGSGTINGEGVYKFMLWAGDDDPDTFRIRIWIEEEATGVETDVYDNGFNQPIGGGSIKVHTN